MKNFLCLLFSTTLLTCGAWANFLELPDDNQQIAEAALTYVGKSYLAPNETKPIDATAIFNNLAPGLYVSVGTERGFLAASVSEITHLLLLDGNFQVVYFNRLNIALLKMSHSRKDYLRLRLHPAASYWYDSQRLSVLTEAERSLITDPRAIRWWHKFVSSSAWFDFHVSPEKRDPHFQSFVKINYLYSYEQYTKIKQLADDGRIEAQLLDYNDNKARRIIVSAIEESGLRLSALDISNAWRRKYMGHKLDKILEDFYTLPGPEIATGKNTVLITTKSVPEINDSCISGTAWNYRTDDLCAINTMIGVTTFVESLFPEEDKKD
ncbi:MAG: hypothetical protein HQK53_06635 [Oligoflexia bacterium]|nr:hypothetical protein [Oligoflexia bacterium]